MWRSIGKRVQNGIFKFIQAWKKMNLSKWLLLRSVIYFLLKIWNLINWIRVKFSLRNSHKNTLWRAEFGTFRNQVLGSTGIRFDWFQYFDWKFLYDWHHLVLYIVRMVFTVFSLSWKSYLHQLVSVWPEKYNFECLYLYCLYKSKT